MRTKVTLVLVFLNVALFFFIFKFERAWRTDDQLREVRRRVLGPEAADIRSLEVTSVTPGGSFSAMRRGDTWWLTKPIEWPANPNAIRSIVQELTLLEHDSSFSTKDLAQNGQKLSDYGLDQPKLTVAFSSGDPGAAGKAVYKLQIGDSTKSGNRLYILSPDGQRIHVVSRTLVDTLSLAPDQLRAASLFTIPVFEARSLSVRGSGVPMLVRNDGTRWSFETPFSGRGSKSAIEIAISNLDSLQPRTFNPPGPPATGPSAMPVLSVTLEGNNRSEKLILWDRVNPAAPPPPAGSAPAAPPAKPDADVEYYAQLDGRDALFTVAIPAPLLDTLLNAPVKLRERRILDFDPRAVTAITIAAPLEPNQPTLTLQRLDQAGAATGGGDWQLVRRDDAAQTARTLPADGAAVQRLLNDQLRTLSADTFENDGPTDSQIEKWGFKRPEREITLALSDITPGKTDAAAGTPRNSTLVLQLGTDTDHRVYARVDPVQYPHGSVYGVTFDFERELPVVSRAWRERTVREFRPPARITALTLAPVGDDATPLYSHTLAAGETWETVLAAEPPKKKEALQHLLEHLRVIRARSFLQDTFTDRIVVAGEERPWKYRLDVTASLPGGAGGEQTSTLKLLLTERVGGAERYAGSSELGLVFQLEQPLFDDLQELIYGPRDPGPPPADRESKP